MKRKWLVAAIILALATCVAFGDKHHLLYIFDVYISPIIWSDQTN